MKYSPITALYSANAIFVLAESMLISLYAIFAEEIGASLVTIGYLGATVIASRIIGLSVVRFSENYKLNSRHYLIGGFLIRGIAWGSLIFANSISSLFFIQAIIGVGSAIGSPGFLAFFAEHLGQKKTYKKFC